MCVCGYVIQLTELVNLRFSGDMLGLGFGIRDCPSFLVGIMFGLSFVFGSMYKTSITRSKDQEQVTDPYVVQHLEKLLQILYNLCETGVCFLNIQLTGTKVRLPKKYTRHNLRLILSPQDRQQSLNLETSPVCSTVPCFPHDDIDDRHACDEYRKSALLIVCHMPESIL